MRQCKLCGMLADIECFVKDKRSSDGRTNVCKSCTNAKNRVWKANNLEKAKQISRESSKKYYSLEKRRKYYIPKDPEKAKATKKAWREQNRPAIRARASMQKKRYKQATPLWLTKEDRTWMRKLYRLAKEFTETGDGVVYHVDHIIPLRGKNVCGLHTPNNLRILDQASNHRKLNQFEPASTTWLH